MGFFDGLSSGVAGLFGSQSSSQSSQQSTGSSGYNALPAFDQQAIQSLITNAQSTLNAPGGAKIYTPLPLTQGEQTAGNLSQPMTQASVTQMANNYMNPYQQYLINAINQNAAAGNSNYQNQIAGSGFAAGTTNRDFLNEGYATGQQDQAIGQSLANNYNTALTTGLTQQNADVTQLMGEGANQRQITAGTNQAPVTAMQSLAQLLGIMPNTSNNQSSGQGTTESTNNSNGGFAQTIGTIASLASVFGL